MNETFSHTMPFGASLERDGVLFRLWAPSAQQVELVLRQDEEEQILRMPEVGGGWVERRVNRVRAGSAYRFRVDRRIDVADPASRFQQHDADGFSVIVDPKAREWTNGSWTGRPWEETVLYQLHVGTFTPKGTFDGVCERLDYLVDLGVTAIALMPVADFPGQRNWGHDGVLPFAPDSAYGDPPSLKRLVDDAHGRGLMVFLDVVYNRFGPESNHIPEYAPQFFTHRFHTPWGAAIDFSRREVRDFFIHNALYWLEEYCFDGLHLDAAHAIFDQQSPDFLEELCRTVHDTFAGRRHVHLLLENDHNSARYLARDADGTPRWFVAQINDDIHHAMHVLATGETQGYYEDYADDPVDHLIRCLAEGFAYQGEASAYRGGRSRGESSEHLPAGAFVAFLQDHDQVCNRALGERIGTIAADERLRALMSIVLLAPATPMLFMGQEWQAPEPFPYFCDFHDHPAGTLRAGRPEEFAGFPEFREPAARARIPDPNALSTFESARLDWRHLDDESHARCRERYRRLLEIRRREIIPRLPESPQSARWSRFAPGGFSASWRLRDGARLGLLANLDAEPCTAAARPAGRLLVATARDRNGVLPPWFAAWFLA